jgi:di/tricarboxylate transporter
MPSDRPGRRQWTRTLAICLLIVALYFVIPVEPGVSGFHRVVRGAVAAVVVVIVAWMVIRQVTRQLGVRRGRASLSGLAIGLVGGLVAFALADYLIAVSYPPEFTQLHTKIDALYFALATATTIGYGDVTAQGQLARTVVMVQMIFSVGVIATGASLLLRRLTEQRQSRDD